MKKKTKNPVTRKKSRVLKLKKKKKPRKRKLTNFGLSAISITLWEEEAAGKRKRKQKGNRESHRGVPNGAVADYYLTGRKNRDDLISQNLDKQMRKETSLVNDKKET